MTGRRERRPSSGAGDAAGAVPAAGGLPGPPRGCILVAGGAPAAREALARRLALRWRVRLVDDPDHVRGALRQRPHLVLLVVDDVDAQTARLVRSVRRTPRGAVASVVLIATAPGPGSELRAVAAGADDLFPADLPAEELMLRVGARIALARARARAERRLRRARRAAQDARGRDEFLSVVSHELRTPLGAILIWTQLLRAAEREGRLDERALDMIERSSRSLAQLIDDLLDASRIATGRLYLEQRPTDLASVVQAAVESARPVAAARGVELAARLEAGLPSVEGDPARLQQVAANLISNAVKFTSGGGRVEVSLARVGDDARLVVTDTGMGIEPDFLPHIFEGSTQAGITSTRRHRGLGLGLAIARHLVERHRGTIRAESAGAGQGATFTVTVPLDPRGHHVRQAPPPAAEPAELSGLRVFLVDDEADTRDAIGMLLRRSGASVRAFGSAAEAFAALAAEPPHVLLSDIAMPHEDGYSLIQRLRALPPAQGGRVRAVALTAYAGAEDRARAMAAGYDEHLAKPVNPADLIRAAARLGRTPPGRDEEV